MKHYIYFEISFFGKPQKITLNMCLVLGVSQVKFLAPTGA